MVSTGSVIADSKKNEHKYHCCQFLQIWVLPWKKDLHPLYQHGVVPEEKKGGILCRSPVV